MSFSLDGTQYIAVPDKGGYACPFGGCSQSYRNRDGLLRHLRQPHGVKLSNGTASVPNPLNAPSPLPPAMENLLATTEAALAGEEEGSNDGGKGTVLDQPEPTPSDVVGGVPSERRHRK